MDIEKTMCVAAPAAQVWALLLDPHVMAGCVPGMQSIEVLSDDEYVALMQVKISFISAKFRLKTRIAERRAPHYLRTEGTGEDASVASSLKQQSEIFLDSLPDGQTELRMKVHVDVMGRLDTFGLNVMKTKADRLWDEFARNLAERLAPDTAVAPEAPQARAPDTVAPEGVAAPARVRGGDDADAHHRERTGFPTSGKIAGSLRRGDHELGRPRRLRSGARHRLSILKQKLNIY